MYNFYFILIIVFINNKIATIIKKIIAVGKLICHHDSIIIIPTLVDGPDSETNDNI